MTSVEIAASLVAETVDRLRASRRRERVVLWLGRREDRLIRVREVFVPVHEAEADFFHIPPEGMAGVLARLRDEGLMVAAQVHTHPHAAFHSDADDRWAIVRHVGALSLVVPQFCQKTTADTFVDDAKVFAVDEQGRFVEVPPHTAYRVTP